MRTLPNLGDRARDRLTGLVGIVTQIGHYLCGDTSIGIQPESQEAGVVPPVHWIDSLRCEVIKPRAYQIEHEVGDK